MEKLTIEIIEMLDELGGSIELKSSIYVKMTPHSPPTKVKLVTKESLQEYTLPVLQTLYQRLKMVIQFGNN